MFIDERIYFKQSLEFILSNPLLGVFLALPLGYWLGNLKFKKIALGSTVGVLLVALIIGQLGVFTFPPLLKNIFFNLFIFTIGFEVGPTFLKSLKKSGIKLLLQSLFFFFIALITSLALIKAFHLTPGSAVGVIAGAFTQSSVIGTGSAAIEELGLSVSTKTSALSQIPIAYGITYIFGTLGVVLFIKTLAPKILRLDLKKATKKFIDETSPLSLGNTEDLTQLITYGVFKVEGVSPLLGQSLKTFEKYYPSLKVEEFWRKGISLRIDEELHFQKDDELVLVGDYSHPYLQMLNLKKHHAKEAHPLPLVEETLMITSEKSIPILKEYLHNKIMFLKGNHHEIPINSVEELRQGSQITVLGPKRTLEEFSQKMGYKIPNQTPTDIAYLSLGLLVGMLLGKIVFSLGGIPITFGEGGGCLFSSLFFGWYRTRSTYVGTISPSTRWFLKSMGLNVFIACVALESGAQFFPALKEMGVKVLFIGMFLSLFPFKRNGCESLIYWDVFILVPSFSNLVI